MVRITCTISFSTDDEPVGRSRKGSFDDHYKRVVWSRDGEHGKYQEEGDDPDAYDGTEDEEVPDISLATFFGGCSLHGANHVFVDKKLSVRQGLWTVVFLLAVSMFLMQVVDRVIYYLQYDYITMLDERNARNMTFPAITLCNYNSFRRSQLSYSDLLFMGPLLGYEDNMAPGIPLAPEPDRQGSRFSLAEFFNRTRHRMDDMLLECKFAGKECGPEHWREIFTRYGKCYTFNSGQDGRPLLITMKGGMGNGLELMLDIQQDEYLPVWGETDETSFEAGIKVQIHTQDEPPFIDQLGFGVAPGFQTFVSCQEQRAVFLSSGDAPYCTPEQYKECADPALDFLVERDNDYCVCDTPCNMTRYGKELSFVKIPSKASAKYLAKKFNKTEQYIAENILVLDIFFEALNYETIEQKKAYELAGLLGDIGGQMGLFIGASILTILELFDYLYEVIKFKLCRCSKKKHQRSSNNERGAVLSLDDVKRHAPCENLGTPSTYPANMLPHHPGQGNFEDFTC
ncbi:acid-sensing ion channel 1 [Sinocyclocheilus rhinocerous]|uniref:acid-sensing ion channel 1 n=1 Tax=Sinocyclocheilus rhinocerous TaxID=307959 RepID=UPI0007B8A3FA|nr:PREDICTED: acid-sensing ion channel 1 [Sinocyclocheilus rhinocerous]